MLCAKEKWESHPVILRVTISRMHVLFHRIKKVKGLQAKMGFDLSKFQATSFTPRTEAVEVPDLKDFFPDEGEAVWTVRGLTGQELGMVNETAQRNKKITAVLEGLISNKSVDNADAIKKLIGADGDVTEDVAKRLEIFRIGSVDPVVDMPDAVKFCTVWPIEFSLITSAIYKLTGQGQEAKKNP